MSDIEYSVITSDVIKSFDCISDQNEPTTLPGGSEKLSVGFQEPD